MSEKYYFIFYAQNYFRSVEKLFVVRNFLIIFPIYFLRQNTTEKLQPEKIGAVTPLRVNILKNNE